MATTNAPPPEPGQLDAADAAITDAQMSSGYHPDGLFQSSLDKSRVCTPEDTIPAGTRLPKPLWIPRLFRYSFCLSGYPDDTAFTVALTRPDGTRDTIRTKPGGNVNLLFTNEMPVGYWRLTISATGTAIPPVSGKVHVTRPQHRTISQTAYEAPSGGAGLSLQVANFPPNSTVNMFLYGPGIVRPLPVMITDRNGDASYSVTARGSDPAGAYQVWCGSGKFGCAGFGK